MPTEPRRASTEAALASVAAATFRVRTLEKALANVQGLLPAPPEIPSLIPAPEAPLFGPDEHRTVNAFVVESTTALAQANAALRRQGVAEVAHPPSTERMLAFLRRKQCAGVGTDSLLTSSTVSGRDELTEETVGLRVRDEAPLASQAVSSRS